MFFQKYKKIIIIIALLIIAPIIYSFFNKSTPSSDDALLVSSNPNTAARQSQSVGNEIISALNQIQTLNLSNDIFEDSVFRSLVDRSESLPSEPVGKNNPFSPIYGEARTTIRATSTPSVNTIINTTQNRNTNNQPVI